MALLTGSYDSDAYDSTLNPKLGHGTSLGHGKALLGLHLKLHR